MAYFDSTKNRALWEIEMVSLRKARADREAGRLPEAKAAAAAVRMEAGSSKKVHMTYMDLLKEEAEATKKAGAREKQGALQRGPKERQKEVGAYEKH